MRIIAVYALFPVLLVAHSVSLNAQTFGGIGTRAEGMAGAFVAVADDASAVYWNPAGIATGATFDLQISSRGESGLFVGASLPVLGASYYRTRELTGLPTVPESPDRQTWGSGEVHVRTLALSNFGATVVQTVVSGLVIGTTVRAVRGSLDAADATTTYDFDAGAMVSVLGMRFGVTGRNLREPTFESGSGTVRLTRQVRVGAALVPRSLPTGVHGPFTLAFDADLTATPDLRGDRRNAAIGGEYWLAGGFLGVRSGFRWSTLGPSRTAVSGGATVRLPRSIFAEGQLTKEKDVEGHTWTVGGRVTF
jgi:hypothetical protein